jgi:hypothetical protein
VIQSITLFDVIRTQLGEMDSFHPDTGRRLILLFPVHNELTVSNIEACLFLKDNYFLKHVGLPVAVHVSE